MTNRIRNQMISAMMVVILLILLNLWTIVIIVMASTITITMHTRIVIAQSTFENESTKHLMINQFNRTTGIFNSEETDKTKAFLLVNFLENAKATKNTKQQKVDFNTITL